MSQEKYRDGETKNSSEIHIQVGWNCGCWCKWASGLQSTTHISEKFEGSGQIKSNLEVGIVSESRRHQELMGVWVCVIL